ncbi:hypothetical protein O974_26695 [Mycobacterium avium 11-0986]|nr:hypothetical protein O974_26695 [Mycobacterium avium 11-0986]
MVPGRELFDRSADRRRSNGVELRGKPDFEARQMFVAFGQESVVLEQAAQVIDMTAGSGCSESFVGEWYCA